jgi:DNA-binding beta-propeller fold protein YncE
MTKLVNRAYMTTATTGTGALTLGTPLAGFRSFADAGVVDGDVVRYILEEGDNWEIGTGTYTATGTALSRTVDESSAGGSAITLTGNAVVYVSASSADFGTGGGDALGTVTGATLDLSTGNFFEVTAADQTLVFSNPPDVHKFTIKVLGGGSVAGFDLGIASYDAVSFSVAAQDTAPTDVFFKPDGTKMYVTGYTGDAVNEYDLSTAWDVTSASYLQNFSVSAQETTPQGIFFKPDGTKMYVIGSTGDDVNEYDLSTAWDVTSASYLQNFSVASQETSPSGIFFKPDGTKMYVIGYAGDDVNEYDLSTAWDITTASYLQNFSVAAQETAPLGIFFKPDGAKMYVVGQSGQDVNEYNLSTAWNVSTASYLRNFSVAAQETFPQDIFFKPDGTKMYVLGNTARAVFQYTTSVATNATITYPASVKFPSGAAPTLPADGEIDTLEFYTVDGGTTYFGYQVGDNHS